MSHTSERRYCPVTRLCEGEQFLQQIIKTNAAQIPNYLL